MHLTDPLRDYALHIFSSVWTPCTGIGCFLISYMTLHTLHTSLGCFLQLFIISLHKNAKLFNQNQKSGTGVCYNDGTRDQGSYYLQDSFPRYLAIGCSFHEPNFSYRILISTASKIENYGLVFGISCVQNVFPKLQKSSGNWMLCSLKEELISRIA